MPLSLQTFLWLHPKSPCLIPISPAFSQCKQNGKLLKTQALCVLQPSRFIACGKSLDAGHFDTKQIYSGGIPSSVDTYRFSATARLSNLLSSQHRIPQFFIAAMETCRAPALCDCEELQVSWICGADIIEGAFRRISAWLPRRRHEPTGPIDIIIDLVLGLIVPRGASKTDIDSIPSAVISSPSDDLCDDKCAICLGPFEYGDAVRNLACCHNFHTEVRAHNQ